MKYFRLSMDAILWDISYANLMMLSATIPKYKSGKDDEGKKGKAIDLGEMTSEDDFNNFFKGI